MGVDILLGLEHWCVEVERGQHTKEALDEGPVYCLTSSLLLYHHQQAVSDASLHHHLAKDVLTEQLQSQVPEQCMLLKHCWSSQNIHEL